MSHVLFTLAANLRSAHYDLAMTNPANTKAAATVTCPKGSGTLTWYSENTGRATYSGKCFNCDGSGKVDARKVEGSKAAKLRTGHALYSVDIINEAADHGDFERAEFYMRRMIPSLFTVGKRNARTVLDALSSGEWRNDNADRREDVRGCVESLEIRAQLRALAIELGREQVLAAA